MPTQYPYYQTPNYYGAYQPQPQPQPQSQGIVWVQGEAGAKSYLVGAGQSVLLMDSEDSVFYIKSTDISGMPMPLRVFEYGERTVNSPHTIAPASTATPNVDLSEYVTRDEFEAFKHSMMGDNINGKESTV